mgnify:CR=1 FL=1
MDYHNHEISMATTPPPSTPSLPSTPPSPPQRAAPPRNRRNADTGERPSHLSHILPRRLCFPDTSFTVKLHCSLYPGKFIKVKANSAKNIFEKMKTLPFSQQNQLLRLITQSQFEVDVEKQDEFNSALDKHIRESQIS